MNEKKKLATFIPLCVFVFGLVIGLIGIISGGIGDYIDKLDFSEFEANVPSNGVLNLDIDVGLADLNVIRTNDTDKFNIKAENITKDILSYSVGNNTLRLSYDTKKWYHTLFLPAYSKNEGVIDLYIPAKIKLKDVSIDVAHDDLSIEYLTAERVFLNAEKGDLKIHDIDCGYASISCGGNTLKGVNLSADSADLDLSCDEAEIENFVSQSPVLNNDGCETKLSGIFEGECSFLSNSGSVGVTMYGEMKKYQFNDLSGDLTVNGSEPKDSRGAEYKIKTDGDVSIEIKE